MADQIAEDGAVIDVDNIPQEGINVNNYNLVGKIIANKKYNFNSIRAGLMGIWGYPSGVAITEAGRNKVLISFRDHDKGRRMLERPLVLQGPAAQPTTLDRHSTYQFNHPQLSGVVDSNARSSLVSYVKNHCRHDRQQVWYSGGDRRPGDEQPAPEQKGVQQTYGHSVLESSQTEIPSGAWNKQATSNSRDG
ncbi:hypothetical protein PIB30_068491 [Stylosanthes scabra]|uniref:Uncharacterized protein n=1 Tax=Stylosanthes scabra TaxID=79078 RepID=A0ABU6SPG4_9FABA|nr:hypothetical protein [Stylosanthes scabra]